MNRDEAQKIIEDANERIKNALNTCVTLSNDLTEAHKVIDQQANQMDFISAALMYLMTRHRFDFINIERQDLADLGKTHYVYIEYSSTSSKVLVEKRLRAVPFSEVVDQCATATPGNIGEKPSDLTEKPESTTSHYEHNPNSEVTALPG